VRGEAARKRGVSMRRVNGRIRLSSTSFFLTTAIWCAAAYAQTLVHFDLPAQTLSRSLRAIGTATNTDVGYNARQVAGLLAPALNADLTVDGALERVLVGTGLRPKRLDDHTIVIAGTELSGADSAETKLLPMRVSALQDSAPTASTGSSSAQEKDLEEIVVTGTHIRGNANKTSPVIVIDQAQIQRSGYSSTQDLFRSLPQNFASGAASEDGAFGGNVLSSQNVDYSSGINLRGLGVTSTLVLLNGHRLAPSAFGTFVDVSQIPLSAIERVEILTDGSSAIYGSDAIGGVVNIILKRDYQGADTLVRYGGTKGGGRDEDLVSQSVGSIWSRGNIVATVQFQRESALPAADRSFTSALPAPNDLFPKTRSYGGTLDGRQELSDSLEFYGDALVSKREFTRSMSTNYPGTGIYRADFNGSAETLDITPGLRYKFTPQWSLDLSGLYGYQKSTNVSGQGFSAADIQNAADDNRFTEKSIDLLINGRLGVMPAGDVGIAFGTSYRTEELDTISVQTPGRTFSINEGRHVTAEFAELHVPIVGESNRIPLIQALELSAALRRDNYSDFGSSTNPHVGLRWTPLSDISLRASYGKSFRAPNAVEEYQEAPGTQQAYIYQVANPTGAGVVPALVLSGSRPLTAERARTVDFGVEYNPRNIEGLNITLDFYDIRYQDRIIIPPIPFNVLQQAQTYGALISPIASDAVAQAIVNAVEAAGGHFNDFYGNGVAGVRYLYDDRQQNAAVVRQSGLDLTSKYAKELGAYTLTSLINVSFIDKIENQFSQNAASINQVNTFGNPAKWRARYTSTLGNKAWSLSGALNVVGSYINNTLSSTTPSVASWTTVDLNATLNADAYFQSPGWKGVSMSLSVLNALNREPPYVDASPVLVQVNYDPANANPLGRFVALALRKKW
jgi:iron complex outermembrane receptor protein